MLIITVALFFVIGAVFGWRRATRALYRRPGSQWDTDEIPRHKIRSSVLARRKRRRYFTGVQFGVGGAILGFGIFRLLMMFAGK